MMRAAVWSLVIGFGAGSLAGLGVLALTGLHAASVLTAVAVSFGVAFCVSMRERR